MTSKESLKNETFKKLSTRNTTIRKIGGSRGIIIDKLFLDVVGLKEGDDIKLVISDDGFSINIKKSGGIF